MADTFDATEYVQSQLAKSGSTGFTCVEAEENILHRMLARKGTAEEIALELNSQDFSNKEYGMFFRAIQSLVAHQSQVDLISVDAEMTKLYGAGGWRSEELIKLMAPHDFTIAGWQDIKDHVRIVKELSQRRQAISSLEGIIAGLRDPTKNIGETLSEISDASDKISAGESEWTNMSDVLLDTFAYIEKRQRGEIKAITTGIKNLDALIGGFFEGEMTVVAARPSVGKSAFGANIALEAAKKGHKVGIVSCEMSAEGLGQRLLSHGSFVDGMTLRRADIDTDGWAKIADAMATMSELPVEFLFDSVNVEDVSKTALRKARRGELDILIVDYLQFMETRRRFDAEHLRIGYISHVLKRLARKAKIPVVVLAQVNRTAEGRMPTKSELKDSGTIEQDADGIIFLHRPESPDDSSVDPRDRAAISVWKDKGFMYLALGVAKQRNGAIGQANVLFNPSVMRYIEIDRTGVTPN